MHTRHSIQLRLGQETPEVFQGERFKINF